MPELSRSPSNPTGYQWVRSPVLWRIALFLALLVIGEWYVKWNPYYHKAFVAAAKHSIGHSIVSGGGAVAPAVSLAAAWNYAVQYFLAVWQAVILGVVVGAAVQVLVPQDWLLKVLGHRRKSSVIAAGALAMPAMMCTCCSAPIVVGLRKQQVPTGSALAFWLANPVLNPATIIFSGFVLGWNFAAVRILFGLALVLVVGLIANRLWADRNIPAAAQETLTRAALVDERPLWARFFAQLLRISLSVIPVYILLVLGVGALRSWFFPAVGLAHADGLLWIVLLAITGTLFVIPTAGEVPIIQTMMHYGLGLGPAYTLLLTLPAISAPSAAMVWRQFPKRALLFTGAAVCVTGLLAGLTGLL